MRVILVAEARVTLFVHSWHPLKIDERSVGKNQARPSNLNPLLGKGNIGVIDAKNFRSLRD